MLILGVMVMILMFVYGTKRHGNISGTGICEKGEAHGVISCGIVRAIRFSDIVLIGRLQN
ncbi:hypothetical protein C5167_011158 [Papaver somniferum]|uniref:Uncharacterized protein n=1 Tax=Papaver somniferum TaxID=3469 RepID=A0A4Y7K652_PAPSO|nr:hypothetical protein C5167_011158 [Papaver somniferum]